LGSQSRRRSTIEIAEHYRPALLCVDDLDSIRVLYWFVRDDTPEPRIHGLGDTPRVPSRRGRPITNAATGYREIFVDLDSADYSFTRP
jgi:hypothetical protein